jgi:hypothetical protein
MAAARSPLPPTRRSSSCDLVALHVSPSTRALKSIISATRVETELHGDELVLSFPLRYEVYHIAGPATNLWVVCHKRAVMSIDGAQLYER